jgi:nucleoside-diphosphate-sugar epimerase
MVDTILLTGSTGALGQVLTGRLACQKRVDHIFSLVRSAKGQSWPVKVTPVLGDITAGPDLGIAPEVSQEILGRVSIVVHAAANTRFSVALEGARSVNVQGTRNLLAFASHCSRLQAVTVLSTVHVAGRRSGKIREDDLWHTAGFVNSYERSKYEAELWLRERMRDLPISVLRLSTVLGDSVTGEVARLAAVHHALRLYYNSLAPMIPGTADSPVDLIATDYAAAAVAFLATDGFESGRTFQICSGDETLALAEMLEMTRQTFLLHRPAWRKRSIEMPAIVDLETFELFARSVRELGDGILQNSVGIIENFVPQLAYPKTYENQCCEQALQRAGITRPAVRDFYPKIVRWLVESDWGLRPVAVQDKNCGQHA